MFFTQYILLVSLKKPPRSSRINVRFQSICCNVEHGINLKLFNYCNQKMVATEACILYNFDQR